MLDSHPACGKGPFLALLIGLSATVSGCSNRDNGSTSATAGSSGYAGAGAAAGSSGAAGVSGAPSVSGGAGQSGGGSSGQGGAGNTGGDAGAATGGDYWKPNPGTSWQWQLTETIDTALEVSVFDIDGFDNDVKVVQALHAQGRKVICYLSVGSYEDWRADARNFSADILGKEYPGWPGERFVDIRAKALRDIIAARFDMCKQKGFDGIEPDNMDVYAADSGFPLTEEDGIEYAKWLASEAHARGLSIGQKNAPEIAKELEPVFDWMLTEDCYDQGWCADVSVYIEHDKPVFMSEYTDTDVDFAAACSWSKPRMYSLILKGRELDAPIEFCP